MEICSKCGSQMSAGAAFCPRCGTQRTAAPPQAQQPPQNQQAAQPQPYQQQYQKPYAPATPPQQPYPPQYPPPAQGYYAQPQYSQPMSPEQNKYRTMGGWLLFFAILTMLGIIINLYNAFTTIGTNTSADVREVMDYLPDEFRTAITLETIAAFLLFGAIALQITFLIFVFSRNPLFLKIYQFAIISVAAISTMNLIACGIMGFEYFEAGEIGSIVRGIISAIVGCFLYTTYYSKSVRVQTYMGSTEYKDRALFTLG